ncbi:MAG: hypothetical protein ACM31C_19165 [Acidobacteriota bacterium]
MIRNLATILLFTSIVACGKKHDDTAAPAPAAATTESPAKEAPAAPAAKQPLTAALFGKTVAPPGPLAKLQFGMSDKAAQQQLEAANTANTLEGVHWWLGIPRNEGKLDDVLVEFPTAKRGVVAEAWGPGKDTDRGGKPVTVWFNPDTGVRATLGDDGDHSTLRFEPYTPLAKLLGDGPQIAMLAKPLTKLSLADAAKAYPDLADKDGHLWLPPTEWEFGGGTPLSPYPIEGPIQSVAFSIPYRKGDASSKAEVMAAIEKKWGKVKAVDELDPKTKIYSKAKPHVEVYEDSYSANAVNVRVAW